VTGIGALRICSAPYARFWGGLIGSLAMCLGRERSSDLVLANDALFPGDILENAWPTLLCDTWES
jgi:hypothetical protein